MLEDKTSTDVNKTKQGLKQYYTIKETKFYVQLMITEIYYVS